MKIIKEWKKVRVLNSRTKLSVRVQPEDIAGAICSDHQNCVIARDIMRQHKAAWVDVGAKVVLIGSDKNHAKRYNLAPVAQDQVRYFDTHKGVFAPCKLVLSTPQIRSEIGPRPNRNRYNSKHVNKPRKQPTR